MRLNSPEIEIAGEPISFTFNDEHVEAIAGETIAAALIAVGVHVKRHNGQGKPRGVFCGMGICYDCLVDVDGKSSQRACLTTACDGMVVRSQYDHRDVLNAVPLTNLPSADIPVTNCELLIVGAGPGGLSAAVVAAQAGLAVTVLDERPAPGGQYFKPLASSHTAANGKKLDTQFVAGVRLTDQARDAGVNILQAVTVWGGVRDDAGKLEISALHAGRAILFQPQRLIIATGAYERALPVPGWTLPGVMTTGAAQTLARSYRVAPGERVLIAGNGPLNLQVACELLRGGVRVVAVLEASASPWRRLNHALRAAWHSPSLMTKGARYLADLKRAGIAVHHQYVLTGVDGENQVETATAAYVSLNDTLESNTELRFNVDAVCMGYGFVASNEIARQLGCKYEFNASGELQIRRTQTCQSSANDIYVVGEAGAIGGAEVARLQGHLAANEIAQRLGYHTSRSSKEIANGLRRHKAFQKALWSLYASAPLALNYSNPDTIICRCESVSYASLERLIDSGVTHPGTLKRLSRVGMGRCQGRYCGALVTELIRQKSGIRPSVTESFAPQFPLKPVPLLALAVEKPEWGGHQRSAAPVASRRPGSDPPIETDVLIIGAGIVGCSTAWYLAKAGVDALVVERAEANAQASGANAGSLHVQLLSFDFGNKAQAGGSPAAATLPLQKAAVTLWREIEGNLNKDFEIRINGGLMVAENAQEVEFLKAKIKLENTYGIDTELISQSDLQSMAPAVSKNMIAAAYCADEGKINPLHATIDILNAGISAGTQIMAQTEVLAIEAERMGYRVSTNRGVIQCRRIVNAAGAWAGHVAEMLDIRLPVHGAPLQMVVTEPTAPLLDHLIAHADRHLTLKQVANGNLIIGGGWTAGYNDQAEHMQVLRSSLEGNLWVAQRVIPALGQLHVIRSWAAMNINIDGAPVLGESPGAKGFYNAVTSNGYTLGPLVAKITSDLITHGRSDWDLTPFEISRFSKR